MKRSKMKDSAYLLRLLRKHAVLRLKLVQDKPAALVLRGSGGMELLFLGSKPWFGFLNDFFQDLLGKIPPTEAEVTLTQELVATVRSPEFVDGATFGELGIEWNADRVTLESALVPEKKPTEETLDSFIPTKVPRFIPPTVGGLSLFDILRRARRSERSVLLSGNPGCGKSLAARAFAQQERLPFYSVSMHAAMDVEDLIGRYVRTNTNWEWRDGPVLRLIKAPSVILLDELDSLPDTSASRLHGLLSERRLSVIEHEGEVVPVHEACLIMASTNDIGFARVSPRLRSRFLIVRMDYDRQVERQLVPDERLRAVFERLRSSPQISTPCSTRLLVSTFQSVTEFGALTALQLLISQFRPAEREFAVRALQQVRWESGREVEPEPIELTP